MSTKYIKIESKIKSVGGRVTTARMFLIGYLLDHNCLVSKKNIEEYLYTLKSKPNRSTIYRDLLYLENIGIIIKTNIDGIDHFELADEHDHHHLICKKCGDVSMVYLEDHEDKLDLQSISKSNKFHILFHKLDFYGICKKCTN